MENYILTDQQMQEADRETIHTDGVPSLLLMERAGTAVAEEIIKIDPMQKPVLCVCGGGNNGGDGWVIARKLLSARYPVAVWDVSGGKYSPDCAHMRALYTGKTYASEPNDGTFDSFGIWVDAVFGTGLNRTVQGRLAQVIARINASGKTVVSVDIPSGLSGTSGNVLGVAVKADYTCAVQAIKTGLILEQGADHAGKICILPIGIRLPTPESYARLSADSDLYSAFPLRKHNVHKGSFGKVCLVTGSRDYSGAALLATAAARKTGTGYVQLCVPASLYPYYIGTYPDVLLSPLPGEDAFAYSPSELAKLLSADCIAVGCGCGVHPEVYQILSYLLTHYTGILLVDADGLNCLSAYGKDVLQNKTCTVILTPHLREFSRLTGLSVAEIRENPIAYAQNFQREYGCVLVLKSNATIVAAQNTVINATGTSALARGGSGDMLTGLIAGIAARTKDATLAAVAGCRLLGRAAEEASLQYTDYAATCTEVLNAIPAVLRKLHTSDPA